MSNTQESKTADIVLPRRLFWEQETFIAAPSLESFTARFGAAAYPQPQFLTSDLGTTAVYELAAPSGNAKRRVLLVHGLNTPALGLLPLARQLQALDADAHVVWFDLWGHGLSSTPLVAHAAHIVHAQILQVLASRQWGAAHLLGYSFGASMATRFALYHPWAVLSVALVAPAGILDTSHFSETLRDLLRDSTGREQEAKEAVLDLLEGGPLVVPTDWRERVARGEIVAEAFRDWELREHPGYPNSVLSMFREGNVYGCEAYFHRFAQLPVKKVVVLGELDGVCSKDKLEELGFDDVQVVQGADHGIVREKPGEVAGIVYGMWTR
ncbi:alpha/beta-hydrolase [Xylaria sp. FL1777]|nr:alpha/beta-hydrolase [Xylaria sp. FL1777]